MSTADARDLAFLGLVIASPVALVLIVAMLRSYSIHLTLTRRRNKEDDP